MFENELIVQMSDLIGGLIPWISRQPPVPQQSGYIGRAGHIADYQNTGIPTHCLRTVSQRTLSAPVTFLSQQISVAANTDIFDALVTNVGTGALPGVGLGGVAPIVFNDANVQVERARLDDLVLFGARAKLAAQVNAGNGGPGIPFNYGLLVESLKDFVRDYVVVRFFWKSDDADPWVNDTPLRYFDRPNADFVPVPPVQWSNRDPKMEMDVRVADFGTGQGGLPRLMVSDNVLDLQLSILFETLWMPNPETCGNFWPGSLCPKEHVKNARGYIGK